MVAEQNPRALRAVPPVATSHDGVVLVVKPRFLFRLLVPLCLVMVAGLVAVLASGAVSRSTAGAAFAVLVALALAIVLLVPVAAGRIELGELRVRRRRLWGWDESISLTDVTELRLRHTPVFGIRALRRGFRIGPLTTAPLTLQLCVDDKSVLVLRTVWWQGWEALARFVASRPGVRLEQRSADRLVRYATDSW